MKGFILIMAMQNGKTGHDRRRRGPENERKHEEMALTDSRWAKYYLCCEEALWEQHSDRVQMVLTSLDRGPGESLPV